MDGKSFLIVDDDAATRRLLMRHLTTAKHTAVVAESAEDGLDWMRRQRFDALIIDDILPGMRGIEAVAEFRKLAPIPVVVMSGDLTRIRYFEALSAGAVAFLPKPLDLQLVLATLERISSL